MATKAKTRVPAAKPGGGRAELVIHEFPVQAGGTQVIVAGDICVLQDGDIATNPIVPAAAGATGTLIIAWEGQAADQAARKIKFVVPMAGDRFKYPLNTATAAKWNQGLFISGAQQFTVGDALAVADVVEVPALVDGTYQSVTEVWVAFRASGANPYNGTALPTYAFATAPDAADVGAGYIAFISDGAAGSPVLAVSDGTNWIRSDTLATITAAA